MRAYAPRSTVREAWVRPGHHDTLTIAFRMFLSSLGASGRVGLLRLDSGSPGLLELDGHSAVSDQTRCSQIQEPEGNSRDVPRAARAAALHKPRGCQATGADTAHHPVATCLLG